MRLKGKKVSSQLKGGIYEVSFGYNPKMEGYTTLMSDIMKLYKIPNPARCVNEETFNKTRRMKL
ncbi:MAG TPA: hypothetical protein C5S37_06640 [Methanophagales archaeon]|nr:hypothetical protein [Methanophagales archaeon]